MLAARLHGSKDLRVEKVPHPGPPGRGEVLLRVTATGICGSDLHSYQDGCIGDSVVKSPLILGHEFAGVVEAVGPDSVDGNFEPLRIGARMRSLRPLRTGASESLPSAALLRELSRQRQPVPVDAHAGTELLSRAGRTR